MIVKIREYQGESNDDDKFDVEYIVDMPNDGDQRRPLVFRRQDLSRQRQRMGLVRHISQVFKDLFLPLGYPQCVDESYLPYQLYDGLQGLCSYWRGVVATKAVLEATGVGNAQATAASAAVPPTHVKVFWSKLPML